MLADCAALARTLGDGRAPGRDRPLRARRPRGRPASADTVDWRGLDLAAAIDAPRVVLESDVRAAALAEARFGAGAGRSPFLYVDRRHGGERLPRRRRGAVRRRARPGDRARRAAGRARSRAGGRSRARAGVERAEDGARRPGAPRSWTRRRPRSGRCSPCSRTPSTRRVLVLGGGLGGEPAFRERVAAAVRPLGRLPAAPPLESSARRSARTAASSAPRCAAATDRPRAVLRRDRSVAGRCRAARVARGDARRAREGRRRRRAARRRGVRRIVASGNGAAYYVAVALWLASLEGRRRPRGRGGAERPRSRAARSRWRPGDALLAVSSSGEFRDLVEAIDDRRARAVRGRHRDPGLDARLAGRRRARSSRCRTSAPSRTRRRSAAASPPRSRSGPRSRATPALRDALARLPRRRSAARSRRPGAGSTTPARSTRRVAVAFGSGPAWAAALEAALLLKEVAGIPAEGVETREGATSAMMALRPGAPRAQPADRPTTRCSTRRRRSAAAAARPCSAPRSSRRADRRLAAVTTFPAAAALGARDRPRARARRRPAGLDGRLLPRRARPGDEPRSRRDRLRQRLRRPVPRHDRAPRARPAAST